MPFLGVQHMSSMSRRGVLSPPYTPYGLEAGPGGPVGLGGTLSGQVGKPRQALLKGGQEERTEAVSPPSRSPPSRSPARKKFHR